LIELTFDQHLPSGAGSIGRAFFFVFTLKSAPGDFFVSCEIGQYSNHQDTLTVNGDPMTHRHLSIDYDEGVPGSYRGVVLKGTATRRFMTGDPQADWADYIAYAKGRKMQVMETSSITHFVFDNVEWRFVLKEDGHEYLVPEDRPEWKDDIAKALSCSG
jgi:hypothetical protein